MNLFLYICSKGLKCRLAVVSIEKVFSKKLSMVRKNWLKRNLQTAVLRIYLMVFHILTYLYIFASRPNSTQGCTPSGFTGAACGKGRLGSDWL